MSAGGVFKLIANDGKADRMIMATELLNKRIKDIMCARAKAGYPDPTPTLADIERTHILFVNAHFKPFASIAYEYNKVPTTSGNSSFSNSAQWSIPMFGDFFNDMVVHARIAETTATSATGLPAFPTYIGPDDQAATNTYSVSADEDSPVANSYTRYTYNYVDFQGTVLDRTTATVQNYVRYVEYPGERLLKKTKFEVNGNPLDDYSSEVMMFYRKFNVQADKLTGWKRLMGQEVPIEAYSDFCTVDGTSVYDGAHVGLTLQAGGAAPVAPTNASVTTRKLGQIVNGPQTPKLTQAALDLWIPLLFWFNLDARLSIPSVSIPYGQRFIIVDIADYQDIITTAPGNVFLKLTTEVWANADGTATGTGITSYKRYVTFEPVHSADSTINAAPTISKFDLYINNIFVNPEIHDIYIKRIGFSLIRVHRVQFDERKISTDRVLMSTLKWPIETLYAGIRPKFNVTRPTRSGLSVTAGNANFWRDWHRLTRLVDQVCDIPAKSESVLPTANADPTALTPTALDGAHAGDAAAFYQSSQVSSERLVYPQSTKTIDTIKVEAHGIQIYQELEDEFFSSYTPFIYGGYNIVTPKDEGAIMINFCLYPGTYQPSAHLNISRAREFYITYTSSFVGSADSNDPANPDAASGELWVIARAINFLLISDGSAVLRYST